MIDSRFFRNLVVVASLGAVYFVAGKLGLAMAIVHPSASLVWPATGIALASFLLLGYRVWPGILLGAFLVNITTAGTVATSIGIAMGNTLEGLLGAYLVNRFANDQNAFNRAHDIFKFTVLAGMACTVSATFGVTSLSLGGFAQWANYGPVWLTWWLGDTVSALVVAPVLILWSTNPHVQWKRDQIFEAGILLLSLVLIGQTVFSEVFSSEIKHYPLEFLCIPFLIWTAFRFGQRESATAIFVLSGIAILGTVQGYGPFVREAQNESLLLLQAFMGVISVMTLTLSAVVSEHKLLEISERKRAEEALRDNKERFTAFMDNNPAVAWMKNENWKYVYLNQPCQRVFNLKLEGIIGKSDFEIWPEATAKELRANDMLVLSSGKPLETFETVPTPDGYPHYWLVFKFPFKDSSGRRFVGGMAVDITERKKAEETLRKSEGRFSGILDISSEAIISIDEAQRIVIFNKGAEQIFGYSQDEAIGQPLDLLLPKRSQTIHRSHIAAIPDSSMTALQMGERQEIYGRRKNGEEFQAEVSISKLELENEKLFTVVLRDITERRRTEEMLVQLASFPEMNPEPIVEADLNGHVHYLNPKAARSIPDVAKRGFQHPFLIGLQSIAAILQKEGKASLVREVQVGEFWYEQVVHYVEESRRIRIYARDISDRKRAVEALEDQAVRDTLTDLYNRRYFNSRMEEEIAGADRNQHTLAIFLCDLDHFKTINDSRGHQAGDDVLKAVAKGIQESTRDTDLAFRWGGDEIVVVLPDVTREGALIVAERIQRGIHAIRRAAKLDLDLSIGVALYPEHGRNVDALIRLADRALYIAKKGGDKIHIGEEEYQLDEQTIKVVFQPVVDVQSKQVIGYEALSRDAQGKLSILELFKRYQAIGQLNELKRLCFKSQLKVAQEVGLRRVFINVDFDVLSQLEFAPMPLGLEVILEISEVEALHDVENHLKVAQRWRRAGYRFAIDDFGAGFISLPFIATLIPDYIKLDRSTILKAVSSETFRKFSKALVHALKNYAREGIIAEGIETQNELKVVKEMEIHLVQGFLLGKPQALNRG